MKTSSKSTGPLVSWQLILRLCVLERSISREAQISLARQRGPALRPASTMRSVGPYLPRMPSEGGAWWPRLATSF